MIDIPGYEAFTKIEPLDKGYSSEKKYYIETTGGKRFLLRIADVPEYNRKKNEYNMMKRVASIDVPMPQPVDLGVCNGGKNVYQLLTWCDGESAETVLPRLGEAEQSALGFQAGKSLRRIHTVPAPQPREKWPDLFKHKADARLQEYCKNSPNSDVVEKIRQYAEKNRDVTEGRPQCLRHNDYHGGNMLVSNGGLIIIDFNDYDFGDPWEEFIFTVFNAQYYHRFSAGQIRGYFDGDPPTEFWRLLAYYTVSFLPTYISWGSIFGDGEVVRRTELSAHILNVCASSPVPVPSWYSGGKYSEIY